MMAGRSAAPLPAAFPLPGDRHAGPRRPERGEPVGVLPSERHEMDFLQAGSRRRMQTLFFRLQHQ